MGDPDRLARELRAEAGLKRWESERNPSAAASAVFAVLGLGAMADLLVLFPVLLWVAGVLLGIFIAAVAFFGVGAVLMVAGPFVIHGAPMAAVGLAGLGVMAGGTCLGAVATIVTIGSVNALVWYGTPAHEPAGSAGLQREPREQSADADPHPRHPRRRQLRAVDRLPRRRLRHRRRAVLCRHDGWRFHHGTWDIDISANDLDGAGLKTVYPRMTPIAQIKA